MSTLIDLLRTASPAEIADALMALDAERPGLGYDVGMTLYERNASKEFPGPAWNWYPTGLPECTLHLTRFTPTRKMEALRGLREIGKMSVQAAGAALGVLSRGERVVIIERVSLDEARAAKVALESLGFTVEGDMEYEEPKSHIRSLHDLSGGPIG